MPNPSISFVIPAFNFAAFLPDTLNSIVDEGYQPVEIVVFDGGSSDNTLAVLDEYRRTRFPELKILVATERGNIDIDLNKGVAAATGDYIWTMSADDALMPGWSKVIGDRLAERPDLLLVPAVHCDIALSPRRNYPILSEAEAGELAFTVTNEDSLLGYLGKVRTSEGLFSFCSACIARREKLLEVPVLEEANGTCWRYSARLIAVLTHYPTAIRVLDRPLILKRGDNDSFAHQGLVRRLKIATLNWDSAIGALNLGTRLREAMLARVKGDIRPTTLMYMSQFVNDREEAAIYKACVESRLGGGDRLERALAATLPRLPRLTFLQGGILKAKAAYLGLRQQLWKTRLPTGSGDAAAG